MKKTIEELLKSVLSQDQINALKEELAAGIRKINTMVDHNEKMKKRKELAVTIIRHVDDLIENSSRSPVLFKALYSAAKQNISKILLPLLEAEIKDNIVNLDDIPDKTASTEQAPQPENQTVAETASHEDAAPVEKPQHHRPPRKEPHQKPREEKEKPEQTEGQNPPQHRNRRRRNNNRNRGGSNQNNNQKPPLPSANDEIN